MKAITNLKWLVLYLMLIKKVLVEQAIKYGSKQLKKTKTSFFMFLTMFFQGG